MVAWLWFKCQECSQIGLLKKDTDLTEEEAPQWTFKKLFGSIPWILVTLMQMRQPKKYGQSNPCVFTVI